jgi:hypothetical protein
LLITLWLAWHGGFSPLEMVSAKADNAVVEVLRRRYPRNLKNSPVVSRSLEYSNPKDDS